MLRHIMRLSVVIVISVWATASAEAASIAIANASFESPAIDLSSNPFGAWPDANDWTEPDLDPLASSNTGVFVNTDPNSFDHIVNADGRQLAFLASALGNGFEQQLAATYKAGCDYRLTVGVGISSRFPPKAEAPADTLNLVLYYLDGNTPIDVASASVEARGLSATQLKDFSLYLPAVNSRDPWAGKSICLAIHATGAAGGFWDLDNVRLVESLPVSVGLANASFESPFVDPNAFPALPMADGWIETDLDAMASTNTGVFANTTPTSPDHVVNADGRQLAFLGSASGNGFEQHLMATYKAGCDYHLTAGVGISSRFPPRAEPPADRLKLVLYYLDANTPVDIASAPVDATGLSATQLKDFSLHALAVDSNAPWAGKSIGVALRAAGQAGGFWDLDNVRLAESLPISISIANASFESPVVDPNGWGAFPVADGWIETDLDVLASTNTGVFLNTPPGSFDHLVNADGKQLAFLASALGNGFEQDLSATYKTGCTYRLTVAVGVSARYSPAVLEPVGTLNLVLYYLDGATRLDIASRTVEAKGLSSTYLQDVSLYLPTVRAGDAWAGKTIGLAIRATGLPGGFWDLDNVRLGESLPAKDKKK